MEKRVHRLGSSPLQPSQLPLLNLAECCCFDKERTKKNTSMGLGRRRTGKGKDNSSCAGAQDRGGRRWSLGGGEVVYAWLSTCFRSWPKLRLAWGSATTRDREKMAFGVLSWVIVEPRPRRRCLEMGFIMGFKGNEGVMLMFFWGN